MENIIKIKNIKLGEGAPKICVPVIEKNEKEIIKYIKYINKLPIDIIEWRADFYLEILTLKERDIKNIIKLAKENNIKTIISNHDFNKTPSKKHIVYIINKMIKLKCDISKVAYMPKNKKDVINLLEAVSEIKDFPIIAISMGKLGIITRIFGSVITFASAKSSSAPGQIEAMKLKYILDNLYN